MRQRWLKWREFEGHGTEREESDGSVKRDVGSAEKRTGRWSEGVGRDEEAKRQGIGGRTAVRYKSKETQKMAWKGR